MSWIDDLNNRPDVMSYDQFFKTSTIDRLARERKAKTQTASKQSKQGGASDWFSTIGGLGGGVGGGLAGGALAGTAVLPGVGTVAGGILGAILGGAGGSALGKVAENAAEGEADLGKDVAGEALLGGVTSVGPIRGINVIAKGGKALATGGGKQGTLDAIEKAATETPIRNMFSKGAANASDSMSVKALRLTPGQATNYADKYGEDVAQTLRTQGLQGADSAAINTRRQGLDNEFSRIVTTAPNVSKNDLTNNINEQVAKLRAAGPSDSAAMANALEQEAAELYAKYGDNIPASELNALRRNFDQLVNYTEKAANPSRYGVNKRMADSLRTTLQGTADNAGLNADGRTMKDLGMDISKLRTLEKYAKRQENLGRGSGPIGLRDVMALGGGGTAGTVVGGPVGGILGALATAGISRAANSPTSLRTASKLMDKVGGGGTRQTQGVSPLGMAGRFGAVGAVQNGAPFGGPEQPQLDELGLAPEDYDAYSQALSSAGISDAEPAADVLGASAELPAQSNPFGVTLEQVAQEMNQALATGDTKGYQLLADYYDRISEYEANQAPAQEKPLSAEASKVLANANSGLTSLQQLESMIKSGGVPKGTLIPGRELFGGAGANLAGTAAYDTASKNITDVITRLRTGAAITENEEKYYKSMLPQAFDTPEVVAQKMGIFRDLFSSISNRTGSSGGGTTLEDLFANYR